METNQEVTVYRHWQLDQDENNILWLFINRADKSVNSLNQEVVGEFSEILDQVAANSKLTGLIIASNKSSGFIAGADVEQFATFTDVNEAVDMVRTGQGVFDKIAALKIPTVAMISGFCLGGGMELSLACDYRVAEDSKPTRLGLPEVKLGIHPGWGGTIRLPQLIGPMAAMDLILSGRTLSARAAAKMGVVDAAVPLRQLERAARFFIENKPAKHQPSKFNKLFNFTPVRFMLALYLRKMVAKKARPEHYPAPYAVIDNWAHDGASGSKAMYNEATSIAKLLLSETSRNLVHVFFLQEQMKSLGKEVDFKAKHVHVIGSGTMGGDIAAWCVLRGMQVTLQDREAKLIGPAIKRAFNLFSKKLRKPRLIQEAMDRLIPDVSGRGVAKADVIIEAIFEDLQVKQDLFKDLEAKAKPDAILATNTSSIPLDEINQVMQNPKRLVGIHFFNPVPMMPLVEVVTGAKTSTEVTQKSTAFVRQIDRLPLPVKSSPGFLVNRVLMPYLMEAVTLVDEGVPMAAIDEAAVRFGMPMGPIELADTVGLDVCLSVAKNLTTYFGGNVPQSLEDKVAKKQLGRKTGQGFYSFKKGKVQKPKLPKNYQISKDLGRRLIMRMVNEAACCLRENVVANKDLLDAGMIFGTGFAPFTGGPMHYAENLGQDQLLEILNNLRDHYGERFSADSYWQQATVSNSEQVAIAT